MTSFSTPASSAAAWVRRLALAAFLLCFVVVVLGAYVRLTRCGPRLSGLAGLLRLSQPAGAAGSALAQAAYPDTPLEVGKAWREMVHRYAAATLGLIIVMIAALAWPRGGTGSYRSLKRSRFLRRGDPGHARHAHRDLELEAAHRHAALALWSHDARHAVVAVAILASRQGVRRACFRRPAAPWPGAFAARRRLGTHRPHGDRRQIALGGWTSSNYAAVACTDFPTCQGSWWPRMDFADALSSGAGLGINYEGGVLAIRRATRST